jgi:hypothetical protein
MKCVPVCCAGERELNICYVPSVCVRFHYQTQGDTSQYTCWAGTVSWNSHHIDQIMSES